MSAPGRGNLYLDLDLDLDRQDGVAPGWWNLDYYYARAVLLRSNSKNQVTVGIKH